MYIFLFLLWVILNGKFNLEIVVFGLIISAAVYWFMCKFMNYSVKHEIGIIKSLPGIVTYLIGLLIEIIKANLATAAMILRFDEEPEPVLATFTSDLETDTADVILANSITLTPGTITVELEDGDFMVHALDESFAAGLSSSDFVTRLKRLEAQNDELKERKEKKNV